MQKSSPLQFSSVGIQSVAVVEEFPVVQVDLMTRSAAHASALELAFGLTPFRFSRGPHPIFAFSRLPAASARRWLAAEGLAFVVTPDGLRPDGPLTWIQGGFAAAPESSRREN